LKKNNKYNELGEAIIKIPRFEEEEGFYATSRTSALMKRIKEKNTTCEIKLRKLIWHKGYRYRINVKKIPGKPDLVFKNKKVAVFIDGDFWHGYNWENRKNKIKANRGYWIPKIERNIQRDREVTAKLKSLGWQVIRLWEHEVKNDIQGSVEVITAILQK